MADGHTAGPCRPLFRDRRGSWARRVGGIQEMAYGLTSMVGCQRWNRDGSFHVDAVELSITGHDHARRRFRISALMLLVVIVALVQTPVDDRDDHDRRSPRPRERIGPMPGGRLKMDRLISQSGLPVQWNPASLPFFLAAALSAWLVVLAWGRRHEPSAPPLISLLLFEGLWALCEAIEAVLLDPSAQAVMYRLKLSSVALVPPSLLFFVLEYTSRTGAAPRASRC